MFLSINKSWDNNIDIILCGDIRCGTTKPGVINL